MSTESPNRRWTRIFKPDARVEVEDELAFHFEQRVRDNISRGMDPAAARIAAEQRLGDLRLVQTECTSLLEAERRAEARSYFMKMSWLDFRLGFRMLVKYPGLTIVGGLAIALAIAVGAFAFEFGAQVMSAKLPWPDGDRIVALRLWHLASSGVEEQATHDYLIWRKQLKSVEELGAYRDIERNLVTPDGQAAALRMAEITASAFRLARVSPLVGRPLFESDEHANAPPVLLIGEGVWRTLFAGDPAVVGKTVGLGNSQSTIVGVMPEDFGFPVRHNAWAPLRIDASKSGPREGTQIRVFGRLASGVTMDQAQAELDIIGARVTADNPQTHELVRPQVLPYVRSFFSFSWSMIAGLAFGTQAGVVLFLALVCANVAILVFARAATRENEIVVRSALGASRGRIVTQLLAEMLVLGALAALIGLSVVGFALRTAIHLFEAEGELVPFWIRGHISPITAVYAAALAVLAAAITGVVPALKVTHGLGQRLRQAAVGGTGLQFGKTWTGFIVTQVALTVVFMMLTLDAQMDVHRARTMQFGIPAQEYLWAQLEMDRLAMPEASSEPYTEGELARVRATYQELQQRVSAEPNVAAVTYGLQFPGMYHDVWRIDTEDATAAPEAGGGHLIQIASVGMDYFDALGVRFVAGRNFRAGDLESRVVVVNQTFARQVFGAANPVGRRVRFVCAGHRCIANPPDLEPVGARERLYEIAGVVNDIAMTGNPDLIGTEIGGLYQLWTPGGEGGLARMAIHVRGDPQEFAARFRAIATAVDPSLRLDQVRPLDDLYDRSLRAYDVWFQFALIGSSVVLLLSVAGTYSILAFAVARRTREIGIRVALGGDRRRILWAIFSRALTQVMLGVLAGGILVFTLMGGIKSPRGTLLLLVPMAIVLTVCALACIVPTRRALRVQPIQALSAGG
ncbi:MAG: ABC transporter permease [Gemmatimonadota bacterium]